MDINSKSVRVRRLIVMSVLWVCAGLFAQHLCATDTSSSPPQKQMILVLGDSLAAGYGLDPDESFPALLQEKIKASGLPHKVVNAGVSGDTTAGGLGRLDWQLKQRVDVLVLELGGNDGLRGIPPATTKDNLQAIINRTRKAYPDVRIVIAGMQMPPNLGPEYVQAFKDIFPSLAKQNHAALVPFLLEGVGGRAELNQSDRIHPTAEGQKVVAENVWRVLKPLLLQRGESPKSRVSS